MFSKRGEKQFAPHRTEAEEHSAKIFLHLMGSLGHFIITLSLVPRLFALPFQRGKSLSAGHRD
jgi:hypothetical protein